MAGKVFVTIVYFCDLKGVVFSKASTIVSVTQLHRFSFDVSCIGTGHKEVYRRRVWFLIGEPRNGWSINFHPGELLSPVLLKPIGNFDLPDIFPVDIFL